MSNSFHPGTAGETADRLSLRLRHLSEIIFVAVCGFSPLLFIPTPYLPLGSGKFLILLSGISLALFFYALSVLREGKVVFQLPILILSLFALGAVTLSAALLSGDVKDSLFGDGLEIYTASFTLLLFLLTAATGIIAGSKQSIIRLYAFLILSALVLSVFHIIRFLLGPETLSLQLFNDATASPIGSWNALAIFYGLTILLSLTALLQLPLTGVGRTIIAVVSLLALVMLSFINFTVVWYILFAVSVLILLYSLVKNRWTSSRHGSREEIDPFSAIIMSAMAALVSLIFIVGGARLGTVISEPLGLSFVEVRPSLLATIDLAQNTLREDVFFGAGPNRFADVWRLHKDPSINQTIFWNTQFDTGYSYVTTSVIGNGLLGAAAWLLFFLALLWSGARFVFSAASSHDHFWRFIGISSLIASLYLWLIALVYVPSQSVLALAAITTGVFLTTYLRLAPGKRFELSISRHRAHGLALIALTIIVIAGSAGALFVTSKQALAVYEFNRTLGSVTEGDSITKLEEGISEAFAISPNDVFARQLAFYQMLQMQSLLASQSPTTADQQAFQAAAEKGINAARLAVEQDPSDPNNLRLLGQIYTILAAVGVEGASDRASEAYQTARSLDPHNPILRLLSAELAVQKKDPALARSEAEEAVKIRPSYTEALYFLAQLDIAEGKVEQAVVRASGVAQLEPQNAARRYQLGVLLASLKRHDEAIAAFEQAIALDSKYANARYFLALGYAEKGRREEAIEQLKVVRSLSESNTAVDELIRRLENGESITTSEQDTVAERAGDDENVTAEDLEGGLVTPSNPVGQEAAANTTENSNN